MNNTSEDWSPMMAQYRKIKNDYKDTLLFYRMGDFYELFFEDAVKASALLEITLTQRGKKRPVPMAGVPYHAVDSYLQKLINLKEKVAICEQVGQIEKGGLFERKVTRIITPGTVVEENLLQSKNSNVLAVVSLDLTNNKNRQLGYGLAQLETSTGNFSATYIEQDDDLISEIARLEPQEILIPAIEQVPNFLSNMPETQPYPHWHFDYKATTDLLKKHFNCASLESFGCKDNSLTAMAAGIALMYSQQMHQNSLTQISRLKIYKNTDYLVLDANCIKNLELISNNSGKKEHSLLFHLDKTGTPMASRMLKQWLLKPLANPKTIARRQESVTALIKFYNESAEPELEQNLKHLGDVERILSRVAIGNCTPRDLSKLAESLSIFANIKKLISNISALSYLHNPLQLFPEHSNLIKSCIVDNPPATIRDGGFIKQGYNQELDNYKNIQQNLKQILEKIEKNEKERTQINNLKVNYNKVHGFYIEVSRSQTENLPAEYQRRQTLKSTERYITPELKQLEEEVLSADEKALAIEKSLFQDIIKILQKETYDMQFSCSLIAVLDILNNFAKLAVKHNYICPTFGNHMAIKDGRHPLVEIMPEVDFVPNDVKFDDKQTMLLITGPNMGGKSTYMRQIALITILAYMGSFVPARSAQIPEIDRIFTRIGAADDISSGKSTFMVEMTETAQILNQATDKSLVIMDEIGRGTSTYDGLSLAWASSVFLVEKIKAKILFSTHYFELTDLASNYKTVSNYYLDAEEHAKKILFKYKIKPGFAKKSYALQVAALAGVPKEIISMAQKFLEQITQQNSQKLQQPKLEINETDTTKINIESAQHFSLLKKLNNLDLDTLTPIEALLKLKELMAIIQPEKE